MLTATTKTLLKHKQLQFYYSFSTQDSYSKVICFLPAINTSDLKFKTIPFKFAHTPPKMKYLGIHLTKYVGDLCQENCKTLLKDTREELNKWRDSLCSWIVRLNLLRYQFFPTWSADMVYRFSAAAIKIQIYIILCRSTD